MQCAWARVRARVRERARVFQWRFVDELAGRFSDASCRRSPSTFRSPRSTTTAAERGRERANVSGRAQTKTRPQTIGRDGGPDAVHVVVDVVVIVGAALTLLRPAM